MKKASTNAVFFARTFLVAMVLAASLTTATAEARAAVSVCHIPPDDPASFHTITISDDSLQAHLAHGDYQGHCRVIGFLTLFEGFFTPIENAAQEWALTHGVELDILPHGETVDEQLVSLAAMGSVDALVIRPANELSCAQLLDAVGSTPFVQLDSLQFEACGHLYSSVATDNTALGRQAGAALAGLLGNTGEAAIVRLPVRFGAASVDQRAEGADETLVASGIDPTYVELPTPWYFGNAEFGTCCEFYQNVQTARSILSRGGGMLTSFGFANLAVSDCVLGECGQLACDPDPDGTICGVADPIAVADLPASFEWVGVDREFAEGPLCSGKMSLAFLQDVQTMGRLSVERAFEATFVTNWDDIVPQLALLGATSLDSDGLPCP